MKKFILLLSIVLFFSALSYSQTNEELKDRYKLRIGGGSAILALGTATIIGGVAYHFLASENGNEGNLKPKVGGVIAIEVVGTAWATGGAILLGLGIHDRVIYRSKKKNVSMNITGNGVGLTLTF